MRRPIRRRAPQAAVPVFSAPRSAGASYDTMRWLRAPGFMPKGRRVYAIGDVHGCKEKLVTLRAAIAADLAERPVAVPVVVHLGDYIDQGPDSAGVLGVLTGPAPRRACARFF